MNPTTSTRHIEATPDICGGKPRIKGRRITVQQVAIWHERMNISADEIAQQYDLSLDEIYAALSYYFDFRPAIDESIAAGDTFAAELRAKSKSKLKQKIQLEGNYDGVG